MWRPIQRDWRGQFTLPPCLILIHSLLIIITPYDYSLTKFQTARFSTEGPEKFSNPESRNKISNLMITELFYSHILNINRGSLHTRTFRRVHLSVFRYRETKNGFMGPKSFRGFREKGPRRHVWVKFVVGSRLALRVFLPILWFSSPPPPLKNQHFQISIRPG